MPSFNDPTPYERIKGNTPDISKYAQFDWYEPVWYWDTQESMLKDKRKFGRFIGVADDVGQAMTNWILPNLFKPIAQSTVWALTTDESKYPVIQKKLQELGQEINARLGTSVKVI